MIINIILIALLIYFFQFVVAAIINIGNYTRIPRGFVDFVKLTFLPYVLTHLKDI